MSEPTYDAPLADLVVLDLTRALAGPQAAMMLGDLGARVIKVESATGDDTRAWGPPWAGDPGAGRPARLDVLHVRQPQQGVDRPRPQGAPTTGRCWRGWSQRSDVLLENFRTGVLDRLGFPVERLHELNPGLVIGSISGFGHDGPEAGRAGYDQIAQGEGGLMSVTGVGEPTKVGVPIADLLAGMNLAYGVLAALHERTRTGRGRVVRTSLLAGIVGVHAFQGTRWTIAGEVPGLSGSHHPAIAPYGMFATATSPVQVAVGSEGLWQKFAPAVGPRPGRRAVRDQPHPGRPPRRAGRRDRGGLRDRARRALARPAARRRASRRARCARSTTSTRGSRPARRGCCSTSTTRRTGRSRWPAHPSASRTTRSPAAAPSTGRRRCSTSTAPRSGTWLDADVELTAPGCEQPHRVAST